MVVGGGPILIGVGGNLFLGGEKAPLNTCQTALQTMCDEGIIILKQSSWYLSSPVPVPEDEQPWYVNCVASVRSELQPNDLLEKLLSIENKLGRPVQERGGARTVDLDLLAHGEVTCKDYGQPPVTLPHPRMVDRGFVMCPLSEIMPQWRHPLLGLRALDLAYIERDGQNLVRLSPEALEI